MSVKNRFLPLAAGLAAALSLVSCQSLGTVGSVLGDLGFRAPSMEENFQTAAGLADRLSQALQDMTPEQEYYLGRAVAATVFQQYDPLDRPKLNRYLNDIGQSLALRSERPVLYGGYHFIALDSDEINAFATPSGLVMVTRGLISCASSEDELAAILAHEISHVTCRHGLNSIKSARAMDAISQTAGEVGAQMAPAELKQAASALGDAVGDIAKTMMDTGYSQASELEADAKAAELLASAGYDPGALARVLGTMREKLTPGERGFSRTHPSPKIRIAALRDKGDAAPEPNPVRDARFAAAMKGL